MSAESPNTEPPPSDSSSTDPLPPRLAVALFVPLLVYTAVTRLMALGLKPVQHDESMFAYYSHLMLGDRPPYEFMPILHGPLLEWVTAGVFKLLGDSDATMRLFPALCGVGIVIAVWGMREIMGRRAALLAILLIALSPTLLFFSRFCRNDLPFLFTATVMVWGFVRYGRSGGAVPLFVAVLAGAVATTIKETWLIFFFIQLAFLTACWIYSRVKRLPLSQAPAVGSTVLALRRRPFTLGLAISLGVFLNIALYSSFFHYRGHWDGVFEAFQYWLAEHRSHRIEGPYHFYLIHLAIYELPLLVFWSGALVSRLWSTDAGNPARGRQRAGFWVWAVISAMTLFLFWNRPLPGTFDKVAHMTLGLHVWLAAQLVLLVCVACWKHLDRGRTFHAFVDCWAGASFVIFSYAGEKVPWVTAHIALPMTLSCALYADGWLSVWLERENAAGRMRLPRRLAHWSAAAAATFSLGGLLWLSLFVAFVNSGNPIERHTYASSHPEFHLAVKQVIHEAMETPMGTDTRIAFEGEVAWPLWWSLRKFELKTPEVYPGTFPPYVIVDEYAYDAAPGYRDDYTWQQVRFRHYWQPEPLNWKPMRRLDLLLKPRRMLSPEQQALRETVRTEWLKLAKAMLLRDENIQGPTRWDELGGLDAYIGRLKPDRDGVSR